MQIKMYNVSKGIPVELKLKAPHYYDYTDVLVLDADMVVSPSLEPYAGLTASLIEDSLSHIYSIAGEMPDYTDYAGLIGGLCPFGSSYLSADNVKCQGLLFEGLVDLGAETTYHLFYQDGKMVADVAESKAGWLWVGSFVSVAHTPAEFWRMNFAEVGEVSYQMPVVSGFSAANYLVSAKALPTSMFFSMSFRIISRVTIGDNVSSKQSLFWDESANNHGIGIQSSKWRLCGSSIVSGGTVTANTAYWVMFVQNEAVDAKLYYLIDDGSYTESTLPLDESAWTLAVSVEGALFDVSGPQLRIGTGYTTPADYWHGGIDLTATRVDTRAQCEVDGEYPWGTFWRALEVV